MSEPSESRFDQILRVGAHLFSERGYKATSVQDIANEVGMLAGSLYYHIESKEQLLFEIVKRSNQSLIERVQAEPLGELAPEPALNRLMYVHVETVIEHMTLGRVSLQELRELTADHRDEVLQQRVAYQQVVTDLIMRGQREGHWCLRNDPVAVALSITALAGGVTNWYRPDGRWTPGDVAQMHATFACRIPTCDHSAPCHSAAQR